MGSLQRKDTKTGRSEAASPLTPLTAPQPCPVRWLGPRGEKVSGGSQLSLQVPATSEKGH